MRPAVSGADLHITRNVVNVSVIVTSTENHMDQLKTQVGDDLVEKQHPYS